MTGIVQGDFANLALYVDSNDDGTIDAGEITTVGGSGVVDVGVTTITFSTDFTISASATVNYILKGDVSNLVAGDTVTINLGTGNVTLISGSVGHTSATSVTHTADDTVILADHAAGQEADNLEGDLSVTGEELFAFNLTSNADSTVTVSQVIFQLSLVTGILQGDFANLAIYVDDDNSGTIDVGETTTVGGAGTVDSLVSTITFSTGFDISASSTVNYILKGDVSNLVEDDTVTIDLGPSNITLTSGSVGGTSATSVTHTQCGSGAFSYRRPITIDYTKVGLDNIGTLPATGFPVLISLSGEWLQTTTINPTNGRIESADGDDIIFRESDGRTGLYHEIESYDSQASVEILDDWHGNGVDFQTSGLNHDPSPGTNRLVLIAVFAEEATATVSVGTVSLGGVALTKIDEQVVGTGYSNNVWLGYLKDADIPAGTAITVTWVDNNVPDGAYGDPVHVQACTLQNVDQTSPVGNTGKEANTSASSIGSSAGQLNVADGDMVVYATVAGQPGDHTEESGYTEHLELDGVANNFSDATASKSITGTGTEQPVADWSLSTRLAIVTAVINAADTGKLVAWVRIDSLSKESDTVIYMYYGNKCINSSTENVAGVWDSNYVGVWHLSETPPVDSYAYDSTANANNGIFQGLMTSGDQVTGQINGGLDFDGSDDYISTANSLANPQNLTVEAWFKTTSASGKRIVGFENNQTGTGSGSWDRHIYMGTDGYVRFGCYDGTTDVAASTNTLNDGAWHHVVGTQDDAAIIIKIYVDGSFNNSAANNYAQNFAGYWRIGSYKTTGWPSGADGYFLGIIDEVRISNIIRSADWIQTEYNNQNDPGNYGSPGFYTVGDEEGSPATAVDLISFTATGQEASVLVEWETAQEINNLGFNLYRSCERYSSYTKLNRRLIPGLISSVSGKQYTYTDTDVTRGVLYYYMLEDVDLSGMRTMHGPVCVDWDGDGIPDDYDEETVDDDSDEDTGDSDPEVEIPLLELYEVDLGSKGWSPSPNSSATWVKLAVFRARQEEEGVALEWETGYEVDNLGYHIYLEVDGKFYRITTDLVPGSVFKVGAGRELPAGQSYVYFDGLSRCTGQELYWLDCVELNGGRASFGPIRPEVYGQPIPKRLKARFKSITKHQISRAEAIGKIRALREELSSEKIQKQKSQGVFYQFVPDTLSEPRLPPGEEQWILSTKPGVKISIKEDGWYRVGEPELVAAGLDSGVDPRFLQLYADGEEQSMKVTGSDDGRFDPEDGIEFYGTGLDTPFTDARAYWLVVGSRPGRRLDTPFTDIRVGPDKRMRIPRGLRGRGAPLSFPYTVELKERTFYFAALKNGEGENFFGSVISADPVNQLLTVMHADPSPPEDALMEVVVQGATDFSHQIKIQFNYREVGEIVFNGQELWKAEIQVPQGYILEGDNIVTLAAQGGDLDISLVDYIRLTYWRTYTAAEDSLKFTAMGGEWVSIGGFSSAGIRGSGHH